MPINKPANAPPASARRGRGSRKGESAPEPFNDPAAVARKAYELYKQRGGAHGADLDDWLEAERQLKPGPSDVSGPSPVKTRKRKSNAAEIN